ncbi:hypothetical protein LZ30DRAFT_814329 [Colletotrichum cereale]|nr:hypothetical protein LZ30DRAFT_814329 [Colletotrichum cereale]
MESHEFLLHEGKRDQKPTQCSCRQRAVLFISGSILTTFLLIILFAVSTRQTLTDKDCAKLLSPYSPALEAVEYEWVTYQNSFDQPSAYRGQPTSELEQAWNDLIARKSPILPNALTMHLANYRLSELNKSAEGPWRRLSEEQGGGVAGFIEVFHQLHCLNLVRQYTYRDSYDYSGEVPFGDTPAMLRRHVDHCIETIRLNLMCAGDVTPFLVTLDPKNKLGESADFETLHKCRNFAKLADWSKTHVASHELLKNEKEGN